MREEQAQVGIDLRQFCAHEEIRPDLHKPFRYKGHVYATDGRIAVRVADDPNYETGKIAIDKGLKFDEPRTFVKAPRVKLPPMPKPRTVSCIDCDGRGKKHDCPACGCECYTCKGTGSLTERPEVSARFAGQLFDVEYVRMLYSLPDLEYAPSPPSMDGGGLLFEPMYFRFAGGMGVVMPLSREYPKHVDLEAEQQPGEH